MKTFLTTSLLIAIVNISLYAKITTISHTIKDGETLYIIAHKNHTTIEEIRDLNHIKKGDLLKLGRVIKVPTDTYSKDKNSTTADRIIPNCVPYSVKNGDTLYIIAKKHHTTIEEIRVSNSIEKRTKLKIGQQLQVPINTYFPKPIFVLEEIEGIIQHKISKGDTLSDIAEKYNARATEIIALNNIQTNHTLKISSILYVAKDTYFPEEEKILEDIPGMAKHTITQGDTIYDIAIMYHTTIAKIEEINDLDKNERLKLSRVLYIPIDPNIQIKLPKKREKKRVLYTIKKNDTLSKIAKLHKTTIMKICEENNITKKERLKIGIVLTMPKGTHTTKKRRKQKTSIKYTIKKGDSLSRIARKHKISIKKIVKANHMSRNERLKLGRVLVLPLKASYFKTLKAKKKNTARKRFANIEKFKIVEEEESFLTKIFGGKDKFKKIVAMAKAKLGQEYVWGAAGDKDTFDCSGLTNYIFKKNNIILPRRAIAQSRTGKKISRDRLRKGDLVFFDTSKKKKGFVNHVGIYIGDNLFIHASSAKKKVVVTSLNKAFYSQRFKGGRRYEK